MARIAGVNIPDRKHIWVSLTSIYGIGRQLLEQREPREVIRTIHQALVENGVESDLLLLEFEGHAFRGHRAIVKGINTVHDWFVRHGCGLQGER